MLTMTERQYQKAMTLYTAALCVLILWTFTDYGITWDEELQSQYGLAILDYYSSLFKDQRFSEIFNLYLYGGLFDGLASLIDRLSPFTLYESRHLTNAIFGVFAVLGTWRLGRYLEGGAVGLLASLFLVLIPMFYGHMFNNPKDIPFATGMIWTLYYLARCFEEAPQPEFKKILKCGIIYGLTLGVRVGGVMLFVLAFFAIGLSTVHALFRERGTGSVTGTLAYLGRFLKNFFLPFGMIAYGVMLVCWPWAQSHPFTHPLAALSTFSNFPQDVEVLLAGTTYRSTQLPWYYVPLYFLIQLPEFLLILLFVSFGVLPHYLLSLKGPKQRTYILMLLQLLVPLLYAVVRHPALYDAVRHFIFILPLITILAALTLTQIVKKIDRSIVSISLRKVCGLGACCIGIFIVSLHIMIMSKLHPYEYIYANQFAGGVPGIYGRFELDYWGSSFKEAAEKLQENVSAEGGIPPGVMYRVAICGPWSAAMIYLPPDYEPVVANQPADFFLSTTRWMCQNMREGKEVVRIERMGVPLSIIKDLRPSSSTSK